MLEGCSMPKYRKLSFPDDFVKSIEKHIKENSHLGYTSVPDYLKSWARYGLRQELRKASWVVEAPSEDDPPPQG